MRAEIEVALLRCSWGGCLAGLPSTVRASGELRTVVLMTLTMT